MILDFKWHTYTRKFYLREFVIFFLFMLDLFIDINIYAVYIYKTGPDDDSDTYHNHLRMVDQDGNTSVAFKVINICLSLILLMNEPYLMWQNPMWYFTQLSNVVAIILYIMYVITALVGISMGEDATMFLQISYSIIWILVFIRLNFYLRCFDSFAFLVSMIR